MTFASASAGSADPSRTAEVPSARRRWRRFASASLLVAAELFAAATVSAQVGVPPAGVGVQIEKYAGSGVVVEPRGMQFRFQDEAGQEFVVSAAPERVFSGVRYGQIDPLDVRIRGTFEGERLEPGMLVAFHATMSGRRVVEPVERLTIVTPGADRPPGIHDPEDLADGAVFGLFVGQPLKTPESDDSPDARADSGARGRSDRDVPTQKVVIGQIKKATGLDRFTVAAGEKIDVGASLQEGALLFIDSASVADLAAGDPVKLEGAKITENALFAVKVEVERPVPPELLERPEADAPGDPATPVAAAPAAPGSGAKPPAVPAAKTESADPRAAPAVRGRIVEVN